jgi:hypothetical protein
MASTFAAAGASGGLHLIGDLARSDVVLIAEGYATARQAS